MRTPQATPATTAPTPTRPLLLAFSGTWAVGVVKPVLDVLGQAPEYWPANRLDTGLILLSILAFSLAPPVLVGGFLAATRRRAPRLRDRLFRAVFAVLLALSLYNSAGVVVGRPLALAVGSPALAVLLTVQYGRAASLRSFFSWYGVMVVLVPAGFLFWGPTRNLIQWRRKAASPGAAVTIGAPVVFVVFDELNLPSLVDSRGEIDVELFPNFARLAGTSTWFRNATTNYGETTHALPSLVTGRLQPEWNAGTSYRTQPTSLFTLVRAPAGVLALEPATRLCPPGLSGERARGIVENLLQVFTDLVLIYEHVVIPDRLASEIAPLPKRYRDLTGPLLPSAQDAAESTRAPAVLEAVRGQLARGRASLIFLHLELPHAPYVRNPDGTRYSRAEAYEMIGCTKGSLVWLGDAGFYAGQAFQRYLLQTMYADALLGGILDTLGQKQLFHDATVIVTADHGVAFTPGRPRRCLRFDPASVGECNAVPLFWKAPAQTSAKRSDRNVEAIDLLPTLLQQLGASAAAAGMDGGSAFSSPERRSKVFVGKQYRREVWPEVLDASVRGRREVVIVRHPDGSRFVLGARYASFRGRSIEGQVTATQAVALDDPSLAAAIRHFDPASPFRPEFLEGRLNRDAGPVRRVAVAINGVVVDVAEIWRERPGEARFASLFDPVNLRPGHNDLRFIADPALPGR